MQSQVCWSHQRIQERHADMVKANPLAEDLDHVLNNTRDQLDELRGNRIFITGATGFFGCWLLETFAWANQRLHLGAHAVALSRNPQTLAQKAPHLGADSA